jgi:hypothetical protein
MPASLQSSTYVDCVADRNPNSFGPQTVCTTLRSSRTIPSMCGCSRTKCWPRGSGNYSDFQFRASKRSKFVIGLSRIQTICDGHSRSPNCEQACTWDPHTLPIRLKASCSTTCVKAYCSKSRISKISRECQAA